MRGITENMMGKIIQETKIAQAIQSSGKNIIFNLSVQNVGDRAVQACAAGNEVKEAIRFVLNHLPRTYNGKSKQYWLKLLAISVLLDEFGTWRAVESELGCSKSGSDRRRWEKDIAFLDDVVIALRKEEEAIDVSGKNLLK